MKVFVSPAPLPGRVSVCDDAKDVKLDFGKDYQLVFTDGSQTIKAFKKLYLKNIDAYFVVRNLEHFMLKMRAFRNLDFAVLEAPQTGKLSLAAKRINNSRLAPVFPFKGEGNQRLEKMISEYSRVESRLRKGKAPEELLRGIELSFRPRILESIRTSLTSCATYKSPELLCHRIFGILSRGKATLGELEGTSGDLEEVHRTIKSMMHAGVVLKREDYFYLSELLR